ncbi:MAG: tRNA epoxyqueuosine(34) reductase QueG [Acidobacteriota bacterium]
MMNLTQEIRRKAVELGFEKVGFSRASRLDGRNGLEKWLSSGMHGEMHWMARDPEKRLDARQVLASARSVISLALNYYTRPPHLESSYHGRISRYAWGRDYHLVLKDRLRMLTGWILTREESAQALWYSDTGPIMDKAWAHKGGVGWIGKHSNLITKDRGSWLFLAEILVNLDLDSDLEARNHCGTCTRCIQACPTGAIVAPYTIDARLCISYLTIELRGPIPRQLRPLIGNRIFGCDDCQDVCPWNRFAQPTDEADFLPADDNHTPRLIHLMTMTEEEFRRRFRNSPVKRARLAGFLRNVAVALGNSRDPEAVPVLRDSLRRPETLIRVHAAWALGEIGGEHAQAALRDALTREEDQEVRNEIQLALSRIQAAPLAELVQPRLTERNWDNSIG